MPKPVRPHVLKVAMSDEELAEIDRRRQASPCATRAAYARQCLLTGDLDGRDLVAERLGRIGTLLSLICHPHENAALLGPIERRWFVERIERIILILADRDRTE